MHGQAIVSEWINMTFPVAAGSERHTFINAARSATSSPYFARRRPWPCCRTRAPLLISHVLARQALQRMADTAAAELRL